jgi:hypothetical protein
MAGGRMVLEAKTAELAPGGEKAALEELYLRYFQEDHT